MLPQKILESEDKELQQVINNHYAVFPVHERLPKYSLARELGCISKCFLQAERNQGNALLKPAKCYLYKLSLLWMLF